MPLTPNFSAGQNPLTPNIIVLTDTSSGSDGAITQRRVFVQDSYGNYLVETGNTANYTQWDIADSSISLNVLSHDLAGFVTVQWLDINDAVVETLTQSEAFAAFGKQFLYYLVQLQGLTPTIPSDNNYNSNVAILWTAILGGINAVVVNNDVSAAQNSFDRARYMQLNQNNFF